MQSEVERDQCGVDHGKFGTCGLGCHFSRKDDARLDGKIDSLVAMGKVHHI